MFVLSNSMRLLPRFVGSLLFLALVGCNDTRHIPDIVMRDTRSWQLPAEGPVLPAPRGVAVSGSGDSQRTFILDNAGRILVYDVKSILVGQWRMPETSVGKPEGICVLDDGRVIVCDTHYHRIIYFTPDGRVSRQFGKLGNSPSEFIYPVAITKDARENIYIAEYGGNDRIQKFTREGQFLTAFGKFGTGPGDFQRPSGLAWHEGKLYVADAINNRIQVYTDEGRFLGVLAGNGALDLPYGVAWAESSRVLYVIEYGAGRLSRIDPTANVVTGRYGTGGAGDGQFGTPWALAVDSSGKRAWIADTKNRRVVELQF